MLAHEIISARPYAFLDDEEFQNRRTNAVHLRRGLAVDLSTIGSLDPAAISAVHDEIHPTPDSPTSYTTFSRRSWFCGPARLGRPVLAAVLFRSGRLARARSSPAMGHHRSHRGCSGGVRRRGPGVWPRRGHLELSGITTVTALAEATTLPAGRVTFALAALRQEGFAFEDRYTPVPTVPNG